MQNFPGIPSIFLGLASAISWGAGDFTGGLITKRVNVFIVAIISQAFGMLLVLALAILFREPMPLAMDLFYAAVAGISGASGLVIFYRGLAFGRMAIVAPAAAVVTASIPVIFAAQIEGLPGIHQFVGFVLALLAIWLISSTGSGERINIKDLGPPIAAGLGFGLFFILIDRVSTGTVYWALVAARCASLFFLISIAVIFGQAGRPSIDQIPIIALVGVLDVGGNVFYLLAAQAGRLDVAAVLASLYPAMTVFLARTILKEQLSFQQWLGLLVTLLAVILITL